MDKTIENKVGMMRGAPTSTSISSLLDACVRHAPVTGFSIDDMRKRLAVLDKIENAQETFTLNKEELDTAIRCIAEMNWGILDKFVIEFIDTICS